MGKKFIYFLLSVIVLITSLFLFYLVNNSRDSQVLKKDFQSLDVDQRANIGDSWNPPRSQDCAKIIAEISSVTLSNDLTDESLIRSQIIKNTKYAAAGLFKLAKETKDAKIAVWSFKAAAVLSGFPTAIENDDQAKVVDLYDQIGNLVENPPITCDNTLAEST
jgi:hypothetical protein